MMGLERMRALALALMVAERRPLVMLDDEVRLALGMRARRGRFRCDDLQLRLMQLVDSSPLWEARAERALRQVRRTLQAAAPVTAPCPPWPAVRAGRGRA